MIGQHDLRRERHDVGRAKLFLSQCVERHRLKAQGGGHVTPITTLRVQQAQPGAPGSAIHKLIGHVVGILE
jgi:hypothetical protein